MPDPLPIIESGETEICLACGFCCDGTLFGHGVAGPEESPEFLVSIGMTPIEALSGEKGGFRLPCTHFTGLCSIYGSHRPWVCGVFRCRLLRSVKNGGHTVAQALQIVVEAKVMRAALLPDFDALHGDAVALGASPQGDKPSLVARLGAVVPLLFRPEAAQFRKKYGKRLLMVAQLASRLTNDFLPKPQPAGSDTTAGVSTLPK